MSDLAENFNRLFAGLGRSSGRYVVPDDAKPDETGKVLGRAWTTKAPVTLELWRSHLSGKKATVRMERTGEEITGAVGLGIVPIRDDATVVFGAIDVDVYPLDLKALLARVKALGLPLLVCRTKSGGAHLYLFLKEPASAEIARERLMEWAVALGFPGVEVFPKQTRLVESSEGDWINIPYSGGDRSLRYGLKADGSAMTAAEFVAAADAIAVTPEALADFELEIEDDEAWEGSPPCLQILAQNGFGDWGNNGLFNVAIYLKKRFPEDWPDRLDSYNDNYEGLGLIRKDVATIAKSVKKKSYSYKCKDMPISAVCNRAVCLKRAYGVGGQGDPGVVFGNLVKVETVPPVWVWSIDGAEIELSSDELTDQRKFRIAAIDKLSKWPNPMKNEEWADLVRGKLAAARSVKVPEDGTKEGQFWSHLANFCTGRARARTLDEMLMGKAYTDHAAGRVFFRSTDLFAYLTAHRFSGAGERDVWRWLGHRGVGHHEKTLKGKRVDYWSVPAFPEQTEDHDVPRGPKAVEM